MGTGTRPCDALRGRQWVGHPAGPAPGDPSVSEGWRDGMGKGNGYHTAEPSPPPTTRRPLYFHSSTCHSDRSIIRQIIKLIILFSITNGLSVLTLVIGIGSLK